MVRASVMELVQVWVVHSITWVTQFLNTSHYKLHCVCEVHVVVLLYHTVCFCLINNILDLNSLLHVLVVLEQCRSVLLYFSVVHTGSTGRVLVEKTLKKKTLTFLTFISTKETHQRVHRELIVRWCCLLSDTWVVETIKPLLTTFCHRREGETTSAGDSYSSGPVTTGQNIWD